MDFSNLKELLKRFTKIGPAGCAVSVSLDGKQKFAHYEGFADVDAQRLINSETVYRMFSSSKEMTAVAALILFERGAYLLNDPVYEYLPEFRDIKIAPYEANGALESIRPAKEVIRVRDAFCMTTGLTYAGTLNHTQIKTAEVQGRLIAGGEHTLAELMKAIAEEVPLMFEPGDSWNYGMSIDLLGRLIEIWSGKSLGQFLQYELFNPLGMKDTSFFFKGNQRERLAVAYGRGNGDLVRYENPMDAFYEPAFKCELGGQGLLSTLADYTKFGQMLASGGTIDGVRILGSHTIDLMRQNHLTPRQLEGFRNTRYRWPHLLGYGYGLGVRTIIDKVTAGASSGNEFGWSGLAGTWGCYDTKEKLSIQYMHQLLPNSQNMDLYCHPRLRNVIYGCL
ncbi:MAG: beta-lactamase family protein [Syntrophomonadaceae bacterium]|nr:beta-lactamase family protein [Syntrophomonadaceae bacterium]